MQSLVRGLSLELSTLLRISPQTARYWRNPRLHFHTNITTFKNTDLKSLFSPVTSITNGFHTSSADESRIKNRATHKAYWHIKKTNKQGDDPLTPSNAAFLQELARESFVNTRTVPGEIICLMEQCKEIHGIVFL